MFTPESNGNSIPKTPNPNDSELFGLVLKKMIHITLHDGYGFPATKVTDEERERNSAYVEGGLPMVFNMSRYTPEYIGETGLTNDSKTNYGYVFDSSGMRRHAGLAVLGEGPSIKYGEFGRIWMSLTPPEVEADEYTEYAFHTDGTVTMASSIFDEA